MKLIKNIYILAIVLSLFGCKTNKNESVKEEKTEKIYAHEVLAQEIKQTSSYTYLKVLEDEKSYWLATAKFNAAVGTTYYFDQAMVMKDFPSKELDTTFDHILFVDKLFMDIDANYQSQLKRAHVSAKTDQNREKIVIEPLKDGLSIETIYRDKEKYAGKTVKVKGKVVKLNPDIMNMNWIHIQDGSDFDGINDLTITTKDEVTLGEIVIFEGTLQLNKDFGAGYTYDAIVMDARFIE